MNNEKANNGDMPALPMPLAANGQIFSNNDLVVPGQAVGLTKRELFAAMTMQGMCADQGRNGSFEVYAMAAVKMADALLEELEK